MRFLVIFAVASLTACASLPKTEQVGEFGKATTAATAFAKDAITANKTIALRINDELLAHQYIKRSGKDCPADDRECFSLSKSRAKVLPTDRTGVRIRALTALGEYGDALAQAADKGEIDKLQNAAVKLGDAASSLTAAFPLASPIAVPAIKITARGVGFLLGNAYAAEIDEIVQTQNENVIKLAALLHDDFADMADLLSDQALLFRDARKNNLTAVRDDKSIDRLRLYTEFKNARTDYAAIVLLSESASQFKSVFEKLAKAHDALAHNDPDAEQALRNFIALTSDVTDLVKAGRKS
jgi:hypothetical protein